MPITTKAIVLSSLKYGETSLIVKAFTESGGIKSYLLKGVLTAKKGRRKAAYFLPLTQLEVVAYHKNKGSLEKLKDVKIAVPYQTLHTHTIKNSIVLFLSEMLSHSIREPVQDKALFRYLEHALCWLDQHETIANFHLLFLVKLTKHLGFYPNTARNDASYFDLLEGRFSYTPSFNPLIEGKILEAFKKILGINFDDLRVINISKYHRQELLKKVILYFELHVPGLKKPKSLSILNAIFQ